jgi:hypothetical protein
VGPNTRHAHDELLETGVELGVLGLILALGMLASGIRWGLMAGRAPPGSPGRRALPEDRRLGLAMAAGCVGLLLHGMVEVVTRWTVPGALAWLVGGLALGLLSRWSTASAGAEERAGDGEIGAGVTRLVAFLLAVTIAPALPADLRRLSVQADLHRGEELLAAGSTEEARAPLEAVLTSDPENEEALYKLGFVAQEAGSTEEALALYGRLAAQAPDFSEIHLNRGATLYRAGRYDEAAEALETHFRMTRSDAALYHMARIAAARGRIDEARAHLRRLRGLDEAYPRGTLPNGWRPFLREVRPEQIVELETALADRR